jgi:hypothetical protein
VIALIAIVLPSLSCAMRFRIYPTVVTMSRPPARLTSRKRAGNVPERPFPRGMIWLAEPAVIEMLGEEQ